MPPEFWTWLLSALTVLGGGGILTRFLLTRNEKIKQQAEAATATAESAVAQTKVTQAQFEVRQQEWDFITKRADRLMGDVENLEAKVTRIQDRYDKDREASRQRIDALEALVDKLETKLNITERRCDALQIHIEDFYASLALEPMPIQQRIKGRMRTPRLYRDPGAENAPTEEKKEEIN